MRVSGAMTMRLGRSRSPLWTGVKRGWTDMTALVAQGSSDCRRGPARLRFTNYVGLHLPRNRSGHEGVHDPVQSARNDPGPVCPQRVKALGYALLDAHRFHRHGLRIEAELFEHLCVRKRGCQYGDVDT